MDVTDRIKAKAREIGAVEVGVCSSLSLPDNQVSLDRMLPGHCSVVCIMFSHSQTALASADLYLKQYDTIFCYNEIARISHQLARFLEAKGYRAVAVPAFLPLDMADGKMGMVGAIDWKKAAVESGLATWGKSGLVVNPRHGPRTRLGGVITTARLRPDSKSDFSPCGTCQICIEACPAGALLGNGKIDKKCCGEHIFSYGLRAFARLLVDVAKAKDEVSAKEIVHSYRTRELWQALETGNYYYCWTCQSICPIGRGQPISGTDSKA